MTTLHLAIEGMSCSHCIRAVESALDRLPGIQVNQVEIGRATVSVDPAKAGGDALIAALLEEGYQARVEQ